MSSNLANMFDLKDEKQAKEYLDTLLIEYQFQCFEEKRPDGCQRLGDFFEAFRKDLPRALKIYETNCKEEQFGKSCFKSGVYHFLGKGGAKEDCAKAFDFFSKGCSAGHAPSCTNGAMLHHAGKLKKEDGERDVEAAADMFTKGCEGGDSGSCHYLSTYYLTGKYGIPRDYAKAVAYAERACDLGNVAGCHNLSIMYKKGDGVTKNSDLAEKYRKKAEDIQNEHQEIRKYIEFGK